MMNNKKNILFITILTISIFITGCQLDKTKLNKTAENEYSTEDEISEYIDSLSGTTIPDFKLKSINGKDIEREDLKGKNTIMIYVSSGCDACHEMLVDLEKVDKKEPDINFLVVSGDNKEDLIQLNKELNTNINYYLDEFHVLSDKLSLRFFPTTFFINEDLTITEVIVGAKDFSKDIKPLKSYFGYDEDIGNIDIKRLEDDYKETHLGKTAIDFELKDNMGELYKSSYEKHKKRILIFMDTNCSACKAIENDLTRIEKEYPEIAIQRIAGQNKEVINDYLDKNNLDYRVLTDPTGEVMGKKYGVNFVPTILFINEKNIIEDIMIGETDGNKIIMKVEKWNNN